MPKETFYNLAEDKRKLIENVAINEFVEYGYDKASINRIVKNSKIAKGSFYQYFEDKKDLLAHLLANMTKQKLKYITPALMNPTEQNFFTLLREMYVSGLKFGSENEQIALMGNQVLKNKNHPVYKEIIGKQLESAYTYIENMLNLSISKGEIRPNINLSFISYIISAMNVATIEYYFDVVKGKEINIKNFDDDIMETVDLFIDFIKNGIGKQTGGNDND